MGIQISLFLVIDAFSRFSGTLIACSAGLVLQLAKQPLDSTAAASGSGRASVGAGVTVGPWRRLGNAHLTPRITRYLVPANKCSRAGCEPAAPRPQTPRAISEQCGVPSLHCLWRHPTRSFTLPDTCQPASCERSLPVRDEGDEVRAAPKPPQRRHSSADSESAHRAQRVQTYAHMSGRRAIRCSPDPAYQAQAGTGSLALQVECEEMPCANPNHSATK